LGGALLLSLLLCLRNLLGILLHSIEGRLHGRKITRIESQLQSLYVTAKGGLRIVVRRNPHSVTLGV
jgi:hypothetical protein